MYKPDIQRDLRKKLHDVVLKKDHEAGINYLSKMITVESPGHRKLISEITNIPIVNNATVKCLFCCTEVDFAHITPHIFTRKACPNYSLAVGKVTIIQKRKTFSYRVPIDPEEKGSISVCLSMFAEIFDKKKKSMETIHNSVLCSGPVDKRKVNSGGSNKTSYDIVATVEAILETEPRQTSHYAPQDEDNSRKYYFSGNLSFFYFWVKYLNTTGIDDDFIKSSNEFNFYPSYHDLKKRKFQPTVTMYEEKYPDLQLKDGLPRPSVSYTFATSIWRKRKKM